MPRVSQSQSSSFKLFKILQAANNTNINSTLDRRLNRSNRVDSFIVAPTGQVLHHLLTVPPSVVRHVTNPPTRISNQAITPSIRLLLEDLRQISIAKSDHSIVRHHGRVNESADLTVPAMHNIQTISQLVPNPSNRVPIEICHDRQAINEIPTVICCRNNN